jgi:hypothetical protein
LGYGIQGSLAFGSN